jgi:outer membrane protein TolC
VPVTPIHGFGLDAFPPFDDTVLQADLTVRYSLYEGGGRAARGERARALAGAAGAAAEGAAQELIGRTVASYLRVLGLAEVLDAHGRRLEALAAERERVAERFAAGRAAEVERRRIAAAAAAAEAERVRLSAQLDAAERDLARLIGGEPEAARAGRLVAVRLAEEAAPEREALARLALDASPEVARARLEAVAAAAAITIADSARRPSVRAAGEVLEYGGSDGHEDVEWIVGLELLIPLYDGGGVAARVARARAEHEAAAERLRLAEEAVLARLDRVLADLDEARARVASLGEAVASWEEVARIEALRLEVGAGVQADLLDAEADLLAARAGRAEAGYAEQAARVELARVTGALDAGWVARTLVEEP